MVDREERPSTPLRDDNPSSVDLIGIGDLVDQVIATITHENLDPVTVGVNAPWGGGKTTVLQLVQSKLEDRDNIVPVFVSPWEYDATTDPKTALIEEVLAALRDLAKDDHTKFGSVLKKLGELRQRIDVTKAAKLATKSALTLTLPDIGQLMDVLRAEEGGSVPISLQGFRREFAELVSDEELSNVERVVVLVDDLDRALPDTVVESLEAIKLFLSVEKMAFVIAADERNVANSIRQHLQAVGQRTDADKYLEKIIQIPFRVPAPTLQGTAEYLALLLIADAEDPVDVRQALDDTRGEDGTLAQRLDGVIDTAPDQLDLAEELSPILYRHTQGNPRRVKRFLNAYWIRSALATARGVALPAGTYAKLMVAEFLLPDLFARMLGWLATGDLDAKVAEIEDGTGEHADHILEWGRLDPSLREVDLGSYLNLAASLRGETVIDSTLEPELRELANDLLSATDATHRQAANKIDGLDTPHTSAVGRHIAALLRRQDDTAAQSHAARAASAVARNDVAAATIVAELKLADFNRIDPSVPYALLQHSPAVPILDMIRAWADADDGPDELRRAAADALRSVES